MIKTATLLLLGLTAAIAFGCDKDSPAPGSGNDLTGAWKLIEIFADPGDGSGTFRKTDFDKTVEFLPNGVLVVSRGNICRINTNATESTRDTYTLDSNRIITKKCNPVRYYFEDNNLVISMSCFEGCAEKYRRISK